MDNVSSRETSLANVFDQQAQVSHTDIEDIQHSIEAQNEASRINSASGTNHPNIFVRGLPLVWSEAEITAIFQQYGQLTSLRLVKHSISKQSLGYGFVRFKEPGEAHAAIQALDGTSVLGNVLQVKFADADAGPPSSGSTSGLTPSDSCYVKHLPATYDITDVKQLFEPHGDIIDIKLFPCLDQFRGASALVRMITVEGAERAITALNNSTPPGGIQCIIVRFAESPIEKAARITRKERQNLLQNAGLQALAGNLDAAQLQQAIAALHLRGGMNIPSTGRFPGDMSSGGALSGMLPNNNAASTSVGIMNGGGILPSSQHHSLPYQQSHAQPIVQSSICIKGMPAHADRLWIYENFARFGAVVGVRILIDDQTGLCNGTGYVNYGDLMAAQLAQQVMGGGNTGDTVLSVTVQQHHSTNSSSHTAHSINNSQGDTLAW